MSELLHVGYNDFCKILQKYIDILPMLFLGILSLVAKCGQVVKWMPSSHSKRWKDLKPNLRDLGLPFLLRVLQKSTVMM